MNTNILKTSIIAFSLLLFVFSSCKKDEDLNNNTHDFLTAGNWKLIGVTVNPGIVLENGTVITDIYAQLDVCSKDDMLQFNSNGDFISDQGILKCDPEETQIETVGTWELSNDGKTLTIFNPETSEEEPTVASVIT